MRRLSARKKSAPRGADLSHDGLGPYSLAEENAGSEVDGAPFLERPVEEEGELPPALVGPLFVDIVWESVGIERLAALYFVEPKLERRAADDAGEGGLLGLNLADHCRPHRLVT